MVKMFVTHFAITVAHQILVLVTSIRCRDFSALADWSPKLTMSCTPIHIHSVGYINRTCSQFMTLKHMKELFYNTQINIEVGWYQLYEQAYSCRIANITAVPINTNL